MSLKAKLPPEAREGDGSELGYERTTTSPETVAHVMKARFERCHGCDTHMSGEVPVKRHAFPIDNCRGQRQSMRYYCQRLKSGLRQGFDIQTVFRFGHEGTGNIQVTNAPSPGAATRYSGFKYCQPAQRSAASLQRPEAPEGIRLVSLASTSISNGVIGQKRKMKDVYTDTPPDVC